MLINKKKKSRILNISPVNERVIMKKMQKKKEKKYEI